ncbi:hypothetical protein GWK47_046435 [Chionoecetes opilio]|uniref:Uncharacterized protein n=1 Tax=Chionoecetes opilio TaxID=41210 RepID=A0A8J4YD11_CHIOP|nr:hypothetical protein GWK47_046435 [Chionoecetes opilio]
MGAEGRNLVPCYRNVSTSPKGADEDCSMWMSRGVSSGPLWFPCGSPKGITTLTLRTATVYHSEDVTRCLVVLLRDPGEGGSPERLLGTPYVDSGTCPRDASMGCAARLMNTARLGESLQAGHDRRTACKINVAMTDLRVASMCGAGDKWPDAKPV